MKRELLSLALISALSFGLAACGDDSNKDKNSCNASTFTATCEDNTAVSCGENNTLVRDDCTDKGQYCDEGMCHAFDEEEECNLSNFTAYCEENIAITCGTNKKYIKTDCSADNKSCSGGACVNSDVDCTLDSDCSSKTPDKPYCYNHECVATKPSGQIDPCANVDCGSNTCEWGICITDARKKAESEKFNCENANDSYCIGDVLYYCGVSDDTPEVGVFKTYDCAKANAGTCVRADLGHEGIVAECSGNAEMIAKCDASETLSTQLCYGNENYYGKFNCVEDLKGNTAAIYIDSNDVTVCLSGSVCGYDDNGSPTCK